MMRLRYILILCLLLSLAFPAGNASASVRKAGTRTHTVEKGETLSGIAETYGMTVREIKKLNHIRKPRKLKAGSRVLVRLHKRAEPKQAKQSDPEPSQAAVPAMEAPPAQNVFEAVASESRLPRELKELTETPIVKEVKELAATPADGSGGIKEKLIGIARKMLDIPYRFGGNSLLGIDCSGYVQKVFGLLDIVLPRTAREQFRLGKLIDREDLSIGDLVFFRTYAKFPSHVGIYLGDNRFIHASSKDRKVTIDSLDAPYYLKRFIGARRLEMKEPADEI